MEQITIGNLLAPLSLLLSVLIVVATLPLWLGAVVFVILKDEDFVGSTCLFTDDSFQGLPAR